MPGGKLETGESWEETLIRECIEEADVEIENIIPLGYQKVSEIKEEKEKPHFHQLRFAAKIKKLNESTIDPATGKIPERKFIHPEEFLEYCPWGEIGKHITHLAKKKIIQD
ncbi:NUDIX hydrolase [archaeon]|mgnify:CR=1 FL=1|nr:NUDIX hydrolase [archaeon]